MRIVLVDGNARPLILTRQARHQSAWADMSERNSHFAAYIFMI